MGFVSFGNNNLIKAITGNVILSENNSLENVSKLETKKTAGNDLGTNDEILKAFSKGKEKVRVIVLGENSSDNSKIKTYKNKINKIKHSYSSVNGFSAEITSEEFETLKKSGLHIFKDKIYHTNLDVSIPQISADDVWNLKSNDLNLTGTSQTVCIIDTGVNYSHSAFGNCYGENNISSSCKIIGGYNFVNESSNPMDDNGHGTHVAGIVASTDNTYMGVSPNMKIISIKALGSDGSGSGEDVAAGIDWCVNNASKFNISVISMSLGDDSMHNSYCNDDYFASFINNAVANNISVVVSAGNCDQPGQTCTDGVAAPACVENATIAGTVNDADEISFMRGALLELMAPGINIMSVSYTGGYIEYNGTSMSAPHVAGAIALINQYLKLSGQIKTPQEIENVLNNTGIILDDTAESGYNFSRIDVYSAILSLDIDAPNVTLISPIDDKVNLTNNQTFVCNATDWQLVNVTFEIWNSSELYYNETKNLTGNSNETSFNLTDMPLGSYDWNCFVYDVEDNLGNATNFSLTIGGIFVNLTSPENNSYTNINETDFVCNLTSEEIHELSNVTFYLWNSSALVRNETKNISGITNGTIFKWTLTEETNYNWNCLGINNNFYNSSAENNFTMTYDATAPIINLSDVGDGTSTIIEFSFNVSDSNPVSNCSVYVDNVRTSNTSVINNSGVNHISVSGLSTMTHYAYVNCSDGAGNIGNSSTISFTINSPPVVQSSGGGGGGGGRGISTAPKIYKATTGEVAKSYTQSLKKDEKINFSIFDFKGGRHLLTVDDVGIDYVDLTIESEPINLKLGVGQSARLNLTSAVYYDLFIKLNKIIGNSAELTIQLINEPIEVKVVEVIEEKVVETEAIEETENYFWIIGGMGCLLIFAFVIIVLLIIKVRKKLKTPKSKKNYGKRKKIKT